MEGSATFSWQSRDLHISRQLQLFLDNEDLGPNLKKNHIIRSCMLTSPLFGSKDTAYLALLKVCS